MNISIRLKTDKRNKDGSSPVILDLTFDSKRIKKVIPKVRCKESHWDAKRQRVKVNLKSEEYNHHIEYNEIIDDLEKRAKEISRYFLLNKITPTKELIDKKLTQQETINITHQFFPSFEEFIEINKPIKALSTIKKYRTTFNVLKEFESYLKEPIHFDMINVQFEEQYRDYAFNKKKQLNNYYGKHIAILKSFMRWAEEREYHNNRKYEKFKVIQEDIEVIYLTPLEFSTLYHFEFTSDRLKHVRDIYCFGCTTGLRYSDISTLKGSNIFEDHLKMNITKTKKTDHIIPLNKFSKQILEKYKDGVYYPLPIISSQKFNTYIKECCKLAGIDTPTTITRYMGQKRIEKTVPKYELITSHTARKTFTTLSLINGMSITATKSITGHKGDRDFRKYVNVSDDYKRTEMLNAWDNM